ncbi:MAG: proton-conducting transporter membrane subunit [Bacteroidales bacterium]
MNCVALPILIPLVLMIIQIFFRRKIFSQWLGISGSLLLLLSTFYLFGQVTNHGILTLNVGGWPAPYGITLVIDYLSILMLVISAVIIFCISIYAVSFLKTTGKKQRFYIAFYALILGLNGAFITGDVFNLYVWFEVMLISSFVLITLGSSKEQLSGGIKYLALNLVGSLLFLAGIGLLFGKTGTLNMAQLAEILREDDSAILLNTSAMLFFVAFGIKAAIFPLFFWLPASYHTPNITITSLFAGLLTKVGVYTMIRFFTLFFVQDQPFWHTLLLTLAGLTMFIGGSAAIAQYEIRRILSYHIISQIGYMVMGLGIFTPLGLAGGIFFTLHNMIAKTNAFLVSGMVFKLKGNYHLKNIGGLVKQSPLLAVLFIIPAFALAGVPPLSGFFAKFILIKAGFEDGHYFVTSVAVFTGLLTLYSMIKIWNEAFLKKPPEDPTQEKDTYELSFVEVFPSLLLGMISLGMGIFASSVFGYTMEAANQLINPSIYIETVLYNQ